MFQDVFKSDFGQITTPVGNITQELINENFKQRLPK